MLKFKKEAQTTSLRAENTRKRLLRATMLDSDSLLIRYETSYNGLDEELAEDMARQYGENVVVTGRGHTWLGRARDAFLNPFSWCCWP